MFVNYVRNTERPSPINLALARFVVGFWLVWKTIWYDWGRIVATPYQDAVTVAHQWAIPAAAPWLLTVEKYLLVVLLCLFVVGYRTRITAAVSSLVLAHLATVRATLVATGETQNIFLGTMILIFFALYADEDELSLDGLRRIDNRSLDSTVGRLTDDGDERFEMSALRYSLLFIALLYFSSGLSKVVQGGGLGFVVPDNLARLVLVRSYVYPWSDLPLVIVEYPALATLGGIGTLVLELGLLVALLAGVLYTPLLAGLMLFALSNAAILGIFFADNLFILALFLAWDDAYARTLTDRSLTVVFDDRCLLCVRALYPFELLDTADTVAFVPQGAAPDRYRERDGVDFDSAMYAFHDGTAYEGYDAFVELFRQFRVFFPVVWLLSLPPVERVGTRVYRYVADNRGRQFACRPETGLYPDDDTDLGRATNDRAGDSGRQK